LTLPALVWSVVVPPVNVARLLRVRAAHQTESERHAGRGGYDLSLSALVFHRFAPY